MNVVKMLVLKYMIYIYIRIVLLLMLLIISIVYVGRYLDTGGSHSVLETLSSSFSTTPASKKDKGGAADSAAGI